MVIDDSSHHLTGSVFELERLAQQPRVTVYTRYGEDVAMRDLLLLHNLQGDYLN